MVKKPVDYLDSDSGLRVVIYQADNGSFGLKTYFNNIKVDVSIYDFGLPFLKGLQKAIGEFLET